MQKVKEKYPPGSTLTQMESAVSGNGTNASNKTAPPAPSKNETHSLPQTQTKQQSPPNESHAKIKNSSQIIEEDKKVKEKMKNYMDHEKHEKDAKDFVKKSMEDTKNLLNEVKSIEIQDHKAQEQVKKIMKQTSNQKKKVQKKGHKKTLKKRDTDIEAKMKAFIKKEKTAKKQLDQKDDIGRLKALDKGHQPQRLVAHQQAPIAASVQSREYTNEDYEQVQALEKVYERQDEEKLGKPLPSWSIDSGHDIDKSKEMHDRYSVKTNKTSEKRKLQRLIEDTDADNRVAQLENPQGDTEEGLTQSDEQTEELPETDADEIPLEPEFQEGHNDDHDKIIKELAKKIKLTPEEKKGFVEEPQSKTTTKDDEPEEDDMLELGTQLELGAESQLTSQSQLTMQAAAQAKLQALAQSQTQALLNTQATATAQSKVQVGDQNLIDALKRQIASMEARKNPGQAAAAAKKKAVNNIQKALTSKILKRLDDTQPLVNVFSKMQSLTKMMPAIQDFERRLGILQQVEPIIENALSTLNKVIDLKNSPFMPAMMAPPPKPAEAPADGGFSLDSLSSIAAAPAAPAMDQSALMALLGQQQAAAAPAQDPTAALLAQLQAQAAPAAEPELDLSALGLGGGLGGLPQLAGLQLAQTGGAPDNSEANQENMLIAKLLGK